MSGISEPSPSLVLVASEDDLGQLRDEAGSLPEAGWEFVPISLLVGSDAEDGKDDSEIRREMDERYNRLRGKMLVRLIRVNLSSHESRTEGAQSMASAIKEWKVIKSRIGQRLDEREEGIQFCTILVVEEGDFLEEHYEALQKLSASLGRGGEGRHRIYLLTRQLEHGDMGNEVLHAIHCWPIFVGGLLQQLVQASAKWRRQQKFVDGWYGWRFRSLTIEIPADVIQRRSREFTKLINEKILVPEEGKSVEAYDPMEAIDLGVDGPVLDLGDTGAQAPELWASGRAKAALQKERSGFDSTARAELEGEARKAHENAIGEVRVMASLGEKDPVANDAARPLQRTWKKTWKFIGRVRDAASYLFHFNSPGSAETGGTGDEVSQQVSKTIDKLTALRGTKKQLDEKADSDAGELDVARCHFLPAGMRTGIAIAAGMAVFFSLFFAVFLIHRVVPGDQPWISSASKMALAGLFGVALMSFCSWWLQRWRGVVAARNVVASQQKWWSAGVDLVRETATQARRSEAVRVWRWCREIRDRTRGNAGRVLMVLSEELQESPSVRPVLEAVGGHSADPKAAQQKRVARDEVSRSFRFSGNLKPEDGGQDEAGLLDEAEKKFRAIWQEYLEGHDPDGRGCFPILPLIDALDGFELELDRDLRTTLIERARKKLASELNSGLRDELKTLLYGASNRTFFSSSYASVNLPQNAIYDDCVRSWEDFIGCFKMQNNLVENFLTCDDLNTNEIATLYSECRIRPKPPGDSEKKKSAKRPEPKTLEFVPERRNP